MSALGNDNTTKNADNSSKNSTLLDDNFAPFSMSESQRIVWIAIFSILMIAATVGNSLVVWIVLGE